MVNQKLKSVHLFQEHKWKSTLFFTLYKIISLYHGILLLFSSRIMVSPVKTLGDILSCYTKINSFHKN